MPRGSWCLSIYSAPSICLETSCNRRHYGAERFKILHTPGVGPATQLHLREVRTLQMSIDGTSLCSGPRQAPAPPPISPTRAVRASSTGEKRSQTSTSCPPPALHLPVSRRHVLWLSWTTAARQAPTCTPKGRPAMPSTFQRSAEQADARGALAPALAGIGVREAPRTHWCEKSDFPAGVKWRGHHPEGLCGGPPRPEED